MSWSIPIGPLVLPVQVLVLLVAVAVAMWLGGRSAKRAGVRIEREMEIALLIGLLVARLVFVVQYRSAYAAQPWSVLDIRDGGWSPWAGLAGAWFYAITVTRAKATQRRPLLMALAACSAIWVAGSAAVLLKSPAMQGLPKLATVALTGEPVALDQPTGKPTVINLWATWCPPCQREMPVLAHAQAARGDVHFVFLNQGETPATVARFLQSKGLQLDNVLFDPKADVGRDYGSGGLPLTLFFDAQGKLVSSRMGELSAASLQQRLDGLR